METDQISDYVKGAARLRFAVLLNEVDQDFKRDGGTIRYVVDADVVNLFVNPSQSNVEEADRRHKFRRLYVSPFLNQTQTLSPLAIITSEFIFSQSLRDNNKRGETFARYITPSHSQELEDQVEKLIRNLHLNKSGSGRPRIASLITQLDRAVENFSSKPRDEMREKLIGRLIETILKLDKPDNYALQASSMGRLHAESMLAPVSTLFGDEAGPTEIDPHLVASWRAHLRAHVSKPENRIRSDALTLALVEQLNKHHNKNGEVRYLLITGSPSVHEAYANVFCENFSDQLYLNHDREWLNQYFLRSPLQYTPILNYREMPNTISDDDLFEETQEIMDDLFFTSDKDRIELSDFILSGIKRSNFLSSKLLRLLTGSDGLTTRLSATTYTILLQNLRKNWEDINKNSILLNWHLINRRFVQMSELERKYSGSEDEQSFVKVQKELLENVRRGHIALVVRRSLEDLFSKPSFKEFMEQTRSGPSRAPMMIEINFGEMLEGEEIHPFLRKLSDEPLTYVQLDDLIQRAKHVWQVLLFAAAAASFAENWQVAIRFAKEAREAWRSGASVTPAEFEEDDFHEIRFFEAKSRRLSDPLPDSFATAEAALRQCISWHEETNQPNRLARDLTELGTLILSRIAVNCLDMELRETSIDNNNEQEKATEAFEFLQRARGICNNVLDGGARWEDYIHFQCCHNIATVYLMEKIAVPGNPFDGLISAADAKSALEDSVNNSTVPPRIGNFERTGLEMILAEQAEDIQHARRMATDIVNRKMDAKSGIRAPMDSLIVKRIREYAQTLLAN